MSTRFKTAKSCKRSVNHHFRIRVSAFSGSPYMASCDQLWYVMTSSTSHGDVLILSGTVYSFKKYTIEGVSKILVPRDQIYFPSRSRGK